MQDKIDVRTAGSATEFLRWLRLNHKIWRLEVTKDEGWINREKWAFRGQRDADWSLIPSAFRPTATLGYTSKGKAPPLISDIEEQKYLEKRALGDFLFFADRVGLSIAGDAQHFRLPELPGHPPTMDMAWWPWDTVFETLAIAQHHGVPTRLLDFTFDPLVATFFACYDAWKTMKCPSIHAAPWTGPEMLAVWAIHLPLIFKSVKASETIRQESEHCGTPQRDQYARLILVTAPRAQNSYLHHQEGFFLIDLRSDTDSPPYRPFEEVILEIQKDMIEQSTKKEKKQFEKHQIIKLQLPWKHVPEMLALLWNEFYHIARLQPTFDNAVQALNDHRALFVSS